MNFKPNIPEYHDVSYIQTDSPGASSSTSSPTITALNMPYSMWSLHRPTFQPSSTVHPIYTHLPPSPNYMGYQVSSPTSAGFYSPTSPSSDYYYHHPTATQSHISNATSSTLNTSHNSINNSTPFAFYANSPSMYTYPPNDYYNINSRESLHIIEPPQIPIPTQSRSMPLPVQQQQHHQQQQLYQQQVQFQVPMQSQPYSSQFVVGSPQTQRAKRGLSSSLKRSKRKREKQKEDINEEQEVPEKRVRRTRSASASAASSSTTTTTGAAIDDQKNVIPTKKSNPTNNKKSKISTKNKKTTTKSPAPTPVSSPLLSTTGFPDDDANTLGKLVDELSFLNDECATILMMLDSLRNAYLANGPHQTASSPSIQDSHIIEGQQRGSNSFVQNRDIEKEMRIAYDDLMLQVRQVEKKINKVERKSQMINTQQRSIQPNAKSPICSDDTQDQPENKEEENKSP